MKVIVFNTGFEADGIGSGEHAVMDQAQAEALVEKWGGMMKIVADKGVSESLETITEAPEAAEAPKKRGRPAKVESKVETKKRKSR